MKPSTLFLVTIVLSVLYSSANAAGNNNNNNKNANVCAKSNKAFSDGTQNKNGECVLTPMGVIPGVNQMVSTVIRNPPNGAKIPANKAFIIRTKTNNLEAGFFSDAATQYYTESQTLNADGFIQGHSHVTVQKIDNPNEPPDPKVFAFFLGLNNKTDANGELTANVDKGLPAGNYRLCTMVSSFTHQPVLMPVAQRGSQDDCVRFTAMPNGKRRKRDNKKRHYKRKY